MLPDTLHQLPRTERFAYAKLLAVMARANDELTVEEMATFEQRLGTALLSPEQRNQIRAYLKSPPTLEECLTGLGHEAGRLAVRDSVMMAAADGNVDKKEKNYSKRLPITSICKMMLSIDCSNGQRKVMLGCNLE